MNWIMALMVCLGSIVLYVFGETATVYWRHYSSDYNYTLTTVCMCVLYMYLISV